MSVRMTMTVRHRAGRKGTAGCGVSVCPGPHGALRGGVEWCLCVFVWLLGVGGFVFGGLGGYSVVVGFGSVEPFLGGVRFVVALLGLLCL
jgi:hypothetical protein